MCTVTTAYWTNYIHHLLVVAVALVEDDVDGESQHIKNPLIAYSPSPFHSSLSSPSSSCPVQRTLSNDGVERLFIDTNITVHSRGVVDIGAGRICICTSTYV